MNNFKTLVKINLKNMFSAMSIKNGSKKKKIGMIILFAFLGVYLLGFGFYMAYSMAKQMPPQGYNTILFIGFAFAFLLMLINTMFSANLYIFKSKDFDTLITLPIKKTTIVLSKFVSLLLLCYVYAFFAFFPFALVYYIFAFNIWSLLLTIFVFAIFPLFTIFLGFVLSFLINLISKSLKHSNIILILLSLVLVGAMVYVNTSFENLFTAFITNTESTMGVLNAVLFPIFFATRAICFFDFLSLLYFLLMSIIPLALVVIFIVKYFVKLNSFMQSSFKVKKFDYDKNESSSLDSALIKKEYKRLFASPNYFMNSCITPIIFLLISVVTAFYDVFGFGAIPTQNDLFATMFMLGAMMLMMTNQLTATFSLEGKNFWLLKTLPISFKQIAKAKYTSYLLLYVPASIVGSACLCIAYGFDFKAAVLLACLLTLAVVLSGLIAMIINLKNNNIHYTNEIVVIKQSMGVLYNMLIAVGIVITIYFLYILLLIKVFDFYAYFALVAVAFIIAIYFVYKYLAKNGERLFNTIE